MYDFKLNKGEESINNNKYEYVELNDYDDLVSNFEKQLQVFNKKSISNFNDILDYLCEGSLESKFDKLRF